MKVLFLGSDTFSLNVLLQILSSKHSVCAVITQPPKPSGRGNKLTKTVIHDFAEKQGLPVFTFENLRRSIDQIKKIDYDIALVASYGQILSEEFLSIKPCINVHPSLLPKYRGATPIQTALLNGDKTTGVTIMKVAKAVDAGDIILQEKCDIAEEEGFEILEINLARMGGALAVKALDLYQSGKVKFTPQDDEKATFVQKLSKEDGIINFHNSAEKIYNQFRALSTCVGCYICLNNQKFRVFELKIVDFCGKSGEILQNKKKFIIACKDKAVEILRLQSLSGKSVDANSFLNGFREELKVTNL